MSHQPERTEKNCLNCGTTVAGRYCQQCGQENIAGHMPFFALIKHFIYDIFHFDGKFFDTLKYLLFKPGYVPLQYAQGKRMRYLDPIRMYLFTSAVFFLVLFAVAGLSKMGNITGQQELTKANRFDVASRYHADSISVSDSGLHPLQVLLDTSYAVITGFNNKFVPYDSIYPVQWTQEGKRYAARKIEATSPVTANAKWLDKSLEAKWKKYKQQFDGDTNAMVRDFLDKLAHRFPYLLFLSLPFFAAILKLLYLRRKTFFYFDHAVFTLYHYIFSFILLLLILGASKLDERFGWGVLSLLVTLLVISWPVHLFVAMKRFYKQGWGRTGVKFFLLNLLASLSLLLLFLGFLFYSIYTI